jgi:predicted  nucleic acid-binding Zn-ribbon protein
MNTLKTVFSKLFKEETQLASHEVELGMIQDYENRIELFRKENQQVVDLINKVSAFKSQFKALDKKLMADFDKLKNEGDNIWKKSKELGLETDPAFKLKASVSSIYGNNWDMDAVNFLRK